MSISIEKFYGWAKEQTIGSDTHLYLILGRAQVITASTTNLKVRLPDATRLKPGAPYMYILNAGANSIEVVDKGGNSFSPALTLAQDKVATMLLLEGGTQNGSWAHVIDDSGGISPPVQTKRVYVFGGDGNAVQTARIQEFDTVGNNWTQMTSSSEHHKTGTGFSIGNRGYACGSTISVVHFKLEEYYGDTWTAKTTGDIRADGTTINGKGYLVQGAGGLFVREYDRISDAWTSKGNAPTPAVEVFGGIAGYAYGTYGFSTSVKTYSYEPIADSWVDKSSAAPSPDRGFCSGDATDSKFFVLFGYKGTYLADCEEYDPTGNSWVSKQDYSVGARRSGSLVTANGKLYGSHGADGGGLRDDMLEMDPGVNSWVVRSDSLFINSLVHWSGWQIVP